MKKGTGLFVLIIGLIVIGGILLFKNALPAVLKVALIAGGIAVAVIVALIVIGIILAVKAGSDDAKKKKAVNVKTGSNLDAEQTEVIRKAREQLLELRRLTMRIKNRGVHSKANEICGVADKIIQTLKQKPDKINSVRQFLNYYLPTLGEIISKYKRIEESGVPLEETTEKVQSYLNDIKRAMDKQYESLFADDILDMSVEMEAMKMAVKRDGLISDEEVEVNDQIKLTL